MTLLKHIFPNTPTKACTASALILIVIIVALSHAKASTVITPKIPVYGGMLISSPTEQKEVEATFTFTKSLKLGMTNPDVQDLQEYLNGNGFIIANVGPGSPGNEITHFGNLTKLALIKFQKANKLPATGFFGPLTMKVINQLSEQGPKNLYSIGGTITGVTGPLTLQNNGTDTIIVPPEKGNNFDFTFSTKIANGKSYNVTLTGISFQQCSIANNTGTVNNANITNVQVTCGLHPVGSVSNSQSVNQNQDVNPPTPPVDYATAPSDFMLIPSCSGKDCDKGDYPVGGTTNVIDPGPGGTDRTGAVTDWVGTDKNEADMIKFGVKDSGDATSTITIDGNSYNSGDVYTITSTDSLTIIVTTSESGKTDAVRTFVVSVLPPFSWGRDRWSDNSRSRRDSRYKIR